MVKCGNLTPDGNHDSTRTIWPAKMPVAGAGITDESVTSGMRLVQAKSRMAVRNGFIHDVLAQTEVNTTGCPSHTHLQVALRHQAIASSKQDSPALECSRSHFSLYSKPIETAVSARQTVMWSFAYVAVVVQQEQDVADTDHTVVVYVTEA